MEVMKASRYDVVCNGSPGTSRHASLTSVNHCVRYSKSTRKAKARNTARRFKTAQDPL